MKLMFIPVLAGLLVVGLTLPAEAKKKKDQGGNSVTSLIESTGINLSKKDKAQINNVANSLTGNTKPGKKNNSNSFGNLGSLGTIRDYIFGYQKNNGTKGLPPGLAKKVNNGGSLPPGWQKKVQPGGTFPNNLFGYASPLNYSQVPKFGNPGNGIDYWSIGNKLMKLNRSDNKILDVMDF